MLDYLANDEETMRLYELREKAIHDEVTRIEGALEEGRKQGIKEGMKRVALNLLNQNVNIDLIIATTNLTKEEIQLLSQYN